MFSRQYLIDSRYRVSWAEIVKYIDWDEARNMRLKVERGISFEDIQAAMEEGKMLADVDHPLKTRYPNQKVLIIDFNNFVYVVPYVEDEEKIFLRTIFPSRKLTKKYLFKEKDL